MVRCSRRALGLVAIAACCLTACSGSSGSSATTPSSVAKVTTRSPPAAFDAVSLHAADVVAADHVHLYQQGNDVDGQVSLDLCNADFPSEMHRVRRHQVGTYDQGGRPLGLATETIGYDSPADAQRALAELRAAQANCPTDFRNSRVANEPPTRYVFAAAPDATWPREPGVDRFAVDATISTEAGESLHSEAVYQVAGTALVALYVRYPSGGDAIRPGVGGIEGLAIALGKQLAQLQSV